MVLSSGQDLTLGLLATITLEIIPFRMYTQFPALQPFFKGILEIVFREVNTAFDSASISSIMSKWRPFGFIFSRGNREK
jgi:hypothetical protein